MQAEAIDVHWKATEEGQIVLKACKRASSEAFMIFCFFLFFGYWEFDS
jgi:hypothetical protein